MSLERRFRWRRLFSAQAPKTVQHSAWGRQGRCRAKEVVLVKAMSTLSPAPADGVRRRGNGRAAAAVVRRYERGDRGRTSEVMGPP